MINNKKNREGSEAQYGPRTVGEILHDFLENSNEPLAVAFRHRKAYANTELCVDLKLLKQKPGRLRVGKCLEGILTRDGEEHFTFIEEAAEMKRAAVVSRNPNVPAASALDVLHVQGLLPRGFGGTSHDCWPYRGRRVSEQI